MELFESISREFGEIPLVAENLGIITEDVTEVMEKLGLPGMLVLQFAFSEDFPQNPYAPHNHGRNNFVYTGTHDNSTTRGWFTHEASDDAKRIFSLYTGIDINNDNAAMELMRLSMNSVAHTSITPVQDILNLGREARMNRPSVRYNNWEWRARAGMLDRNISERIREMTWISGRS
jgi:4-alpha-glucanotransferase